MTMTPVFLRQLQQWIKDNELIKFYHSQPWYKARQQRLRLDHYECQVCKARGKHTHATTVHHIQHVKAKPELALDLNNLETICRADHNIEHPEKLAQFNKPKFTNAERW